MEEVVEEDQAILNATSVLSAAACAVGPDQSHQSAPPPHHHRWLWGGEAVHISEYENSVGGEVRR